MTPESEKIPLVQRLLPFTEWIFTLKWATLKADALAGLTVALVLIPQSMAYAQLAGLPAFYGLYAAFLPPMTAALFGSSRQLSTGPVAVVSLLTAVALEPLARIGTPGYIAYALLLALMVGLFQLTLGVLRLGVLVNFLSHPVINGFTNAAAIIIATSQLSKLFGVQVDTEAYHFATLAKVFAAAANHIHWPTLLMGLAAFAIMYALRLIAPHSPTVLVAVLATTLISWLTGFERKLEVPLSALSAPAARALIQKYNLIADEEQRLAAQRTIQRRQQASAQDKNAPFEALMAGHQDEWLALRMTELQPEASLLRREIRKLRLEGVAYAPSGFSGFYLKGALPTKAQGDGRIWRIEMGRGPIPRDGVPLSAGGQV
ncbi:MAG: SulP family inorganic anion transporter, partial [Desulfobacterales bacterium]